MSNAIQLGMASARRIGEKDGDAAARTAVQGIWLGLLLSLSIGVLGAWFAPELLGLMGADSEVVRTGSNVPEAAHRGSAIGD
jgi:Na+-driven multidrug efflux pump